LHPAKEALAIKEPEHNLRIIDLSVRYDRERAIDKND
jgi:hypothetical protein